MKIRSLILSAERTIDRLLRVYQANHLPATTYIPLKDLGEKYGLEIVSDASSNDADIKYDRPTETQVKSYAQLLANELSIYTPQFIRDSNVERLVLCANLFSRKHSVSGLAEMGLFKIDTLFLDLSHTRQHYEFSRRTFHHELFHAIDFSDTFEGYIDTEWRKLTDTDYVYLANEDNFTSTESSKPGFITVYSTRSALEDKAELYSYMVMEYEMVLKRCQTDQVLARKVAHMKELLRQFSPHYDELFWDKIARRDELRAKIKGHDASLIEQAKGAPEKRGTVEVEPWLENGNSLWVVTVYQRADGARTREHFYSFNKVRNYLLKLGFSDVTKEDLAQKRIYELI